MPPTYTIRAEVVDIDHDAPRPNDAFLVDTNVWYWMAYTWASQSDSPPRPYQTSIYPDYVNRAVRLGAGIHRCELSLAELAHRIERVEWEVFRLDPRLAATTEKEFRHNFPRERDKVVAEIEAAWAVVASVAKPVAAMITEDTSRSALARLPSQEVDGYDALMLEAMQAAGISALISDDGDFATVPGIVIFTANRGVIRRARDQGRLKQR